MNSELNDQALENVSGGFSEDILWMAKETCGKCTSRESRFCTGSVEMLAEHIQWHGPLVSYGKCPFRLSGLS